MRASPRIYSSDLAFIHDAGFDWFARGAGPELLRILRAHGVLPPRGGRPAARIVEVGCGSGILARTLTHAGYRVLGLDASPAMIRLSRARAPRAAFRVDSLERARIPPCAAVISLGEVVSYVPEPRRKPQVLPSFFRRVHTALRPGGVLLFDFLESAAGRTYPLKIRSGPGWAIFFGAEADPRRRLLTRRIITHREVAGRCRISGETHRLRLYDRGEIAAELTRLGFRVRMRRSYGKLRLLAGDVAVIAVKAESAPAGSRAQAKRRALTASRPGRRASPRVPTRRSRQRARAPGAAR